MNKYGIKILYEGNTDTLEFQTQKERDSAFEDLIQKHANVYSSVQINGKVIIPSKICSFEKVFLHYTNTAVSGSKPVWTLHKNEQ